MQLTVAYGQCAAGNGDVRSAPTTYPLEGGSETVRSPRESASYRRMRGKADG